VITMAYWIRMWDAIKDFFKENYSILKKVYDKDVVLFTAVILVLVPLFILLILGFIFIMIITFFRDLFHPTPELINMIFPFIFFFLFLPMMIGMMIVSARQRNRERLKMIKEKYDTEKKRQDHTITVDEVERKFDKYALSQKEFDFIIKKLEEKHVKSVCPVCGYEELSLSKYFGFSKYYIRTTDFFELDDGLPTIIVACQRCGFLMEHTIFPLDLGDLKRISEKREEGER
jgi:energy-coupling factor transporter transmembrane protein EcfT